MEKECVMIPLGLIDGGVTDEFTCSECEVSIELPYLSRECGYGFCPCCGAKVVDEEDYSGYYVAECGG